MSSSESNPNPHCASRCQLQDGTSSSGSVGRPGRDAQQSIKSPTGRNLEQAAGPSTSTSGSASTMPPNSTRSSPSPGSSTERSVRHSSTPKPQVSSAQETTNGSGNAELKSTDVVAFTSRMIAVARAIESRRPDRLFNDPFAEILAGSEATNSYEDLLNLPIRMYELSRRSPERDVADTSAASENLSYQSPDYLGALGAEDVSLSRRLAIRTRCFDDFFEDCTLPPRCIKQVVMLGAGMDTRGLRLKASTGTSVFEVDQALVLVVKRNIIQGALAASNAFSEESMGGVSEARVIGVEADLGQTGWEEKLLDAGFNPELPSAWILEGLTMLGGINPNFGCPALVARVV
ncbi:unnamed protein product [Ascophyllum nodosum]